MKWSDVAQRHRTNAGVRLHQGRVVSILCNPSEGSTHGDAITERGIVYNVPNSNGYRAAATALRRAKETKEPFTVFRKLAVNEWVDLGDHVVHDVVETPESIAFHLAKA